MATMSIMHSNVVVVLAADSSVPVSAALERRGGAHEHGVGCQEADVHQHHELRP
ncbi:hypothetical protein PR003_g21736 [Phytophthora rubi]|uniref:Uncharacterized protein n=1 Tax=Phytophthora rubi TaxID=129364 RepID=A0A6A3J982_9STRA|nr:hypothetical protein PR002_g20962 [Phytophthora rubi]KAE9304504.1 hypothetical protein PR003_g21736 [Phytophthora rubi]